MKTLTRYTVAGLAMLALTLATTAGAQTLIRDNVIEGRDLKIGSTGSDVVFLQGLLQELGYLSVPFGIPLGYYGGLTKAAVIRYQSENGVINTGYFGPLTKQAMRVQFAARGWLQLLFPGFYNG